MDAYSVHGPKQRSSPPPHRAEKRLSDISSSPEPDEGAGAVADHKYVSPRLYHRHFTSSA